MKDLNKPLIFSVVLHIIVIALFFLLSENREEAITPPLTADIITPEELRQSPPPQPEQRASRAAAAAPSGPSRPTPRQERQIAKKSERKVREKTTPKEELPAPEPQPAKSSPTTQSPGSVASLPSRPSTPPAPSAPPLPLRERLFDREVIGKTARKSNEEEKAADNGITFDTKEFRYRAYMQRLRERIEGSWRYPAEAAEKGIYGDLYIKFTIRKDGKLGNVELVR
ncbi:MAG: hypothetical protein HGA78_07390, partial [Nitrospirales bacterium]|nr:hypothetical protein [Nitrospirales bacterium]